MKALWGVEKTASSRVVSPDAYYNPPQTAPAVPLEAMSTGNSQQLQAHTRAVSMANKERKQQQQMNQPPPPEVSIQNNMPLVPKPFPPKYTGT